MSDFTLVDPARRHSQVVHESSPQLQAVSRQGVIESGTQMLHTIGSDFICKVCIFNGGSCCAGCRHLLDRVGCQQRNTSCTAWLCGFLKYLLYETELLQDWYAYWMQVPGQCYREDFTPEAFFIKKQLELPDLRGLSEALAADLDVLAQAHIAPGFIITLRDKIDKCIDQLDECQHNPVKQARIKRKIKVLSTPFPGFLKELQAYRLKQAPELSRPVD